MRLFGLMLAVLVLYFAAVAIKDAHRRSVIGDVRSSYNSFTTKFERGDGEGACNLLTTTHKERVLSQLSKTRPDLVRGGCEFAFSAGPIPANGPYAAIPTGTDRLIRGVTVRLRGDCAEWRFPSPSNTPVRSYQRGGHWLYDGVGVC